MAKVLQYPIFARESGDVGGAGWHDYRGSWPTLDEALAEVSRLRREGCEDYVIQVVDLETGELAYDDGDDVGLGS